MSDSPSLTSKEFNLFRELIYREFGISLSDKKRTLVQTRLRKWLKSMELFNYKQLYDYLEENPHDLMLLADAITTNVTSFFREKSQWTFLGEHIPKTYENKRKLRIWSAACSSGQEPYSISIFLHSLLKDYDQWDVKILATDLSKDILKKAIEGKYRQKDIEGVPKHYITKYFNANKISEYEKVFNISNTIKDGILFRLFNLVSGNYGIFKNKFDIIFCRNVMIYFDKKTQEQVIDKLLSVLNPGGLLLIGHSESITNPKMNIKTISPSIYVKKGS